MSNRLQLGEEPFDDGRSLLIQRTLATSEKVRGCDSCTEFFTEKRLFEAHQMVHKSRRPYTCTICNRSFCVTETFDAHLRKHAWGHLRKHTDEKPYPCVTSEKSVSEKCSFEEFLKRPTALKILAEQYCKATEKCAISKQSFSEKGSLDKHLKVHTGKKVYVCTVCDKSFFLKELFKQHLKVHAGKNKKLYKCYIYKKRSDHRNLIIHQKAHTAVYTDEKPYVYSISKEEFLTTGSSQTHLKVDEGEKPYESLLEGVAHMSI